MRNQGFNPIIWSARRVGRALESAKERQLRPFDLVSAHYSLLAAISACPGATAAELARELSVTPQNIASLTTRLEQRGLIERLPNQRHANVMEMWISATGEELLASADAAMIELEHAIAQILEEEGAAKFRELLQTLAEGLEQRERDAQAASRADLAKSA